MEIKVAILQRMLPTKTDALGDAKYVGVSYGFMDFFEFSKLSEADYIKLMQEMKHQELIEINLFGYSDIKRSIIQATLLGFEYMAENGNKSPIGFNCQDYTQP